MKKPNQLVITLGCLGANTKQQIFMDFDWEIIQHEFYSPDI